MARDKDGKYYSTSAPPSTSVSYDQWLERQKRPVARPKIQKKLPAKLPAKPARTSGLLYWAYGSNLSVRQMERRCPGAEIVGPLVVDDGALVFRGVADVVARRGSQVAGGLWRITPEHERALDAAEGVSKRFYMKRYLTVAVDGGEPEDVLFYQMRTHRGVMPPNEAYLQTIAEGYADFGLDVNYLDAALSEAWSRKEVTPHLRERHRLRGRPTLARAVPAVEGDEEEEDAA